MQSWGAIRRLNERNVNQKVPSVIYECYNQCCNQLGARIFQGLGRDHKFGGNSDDARLLFSLMYT